MRTLPGLFVVAGLALAAGAVWGITLIVSGGPAAQVLGLTILAASVVGSVGMILSRGRWSLVYTRLVLVGLTALALVVQPAGWVVATGLATVSLLLTLLPWGRAGIRKLPPAEPIPEPAVVLALGLPALPGLAALGDLTAGLEAGSGWLYAFAGLAWALAFAYARAWQPALWLIRLVLGPAAIALGFAIGGAAGLIAAGGALVLVVIAWSNQTRLAVPAAAPVAEAKTPRRAF